MKAIQEAGDHLRSAFEAASADLHVPGFVAGLSWHGETTVIAGGVANRTTGAPMTPDTAFLIGSITKPIVTGLLMQYVETGRLDLDAPVRTYVPELCLGDAATLEALTVRHLLNHSSGIDAADFFPELGKGDDAVQRYVAALAPFGQVHPLGAHISYCNPAFVIVGRLLEVLAGAPFDALLHQRVLGPYGLSRATTTGDQALLHRVAVGHIIEPGKEPRATRRYMLPYAEAPAGTTIIDTVEDLLRVGRIHLADGRTPEGERVMVSETVDAMATPTIGDAQLYGLAVGLGWQLPPANGTQILAHQGGSYGGVSSLLVLPEHDVVYAAFGNATTAGALHLRMNQLVLTELLGLPGFETILPAAGSFDPTRYEGVYQRQHIRTEIVAGAGDTLTAHVSYHYPEGNREMMYEYTGSDAVPPIPLRPVTDTLLMPASVTARGLTVPDALSQGFTFLDPDGEGRFQAVSQDRRLSSRVNQ